MSKIKRIEIKNFIGLSEFSLDPGKVNYLAGHKGSGKSSFLEALEKAFTNKSRRTEVIRHGENEAILYIQTDDGLEIDRRLRSDKADYLKIKKPGEAVPQSESFLRKLINGEIFRPLEFIKKTPEEQAKIILNMLEIPWTMDDIENWFGEIPAVNYEAHILQILKQIEDMYYKQREAVNRDIAVLKAQVQGIRNELPANYDGEYWRVQKVQEYYGKVAEAEEVNRKIAAAQNLIEGLESRIATIKANAETDKQTKKNAFDRQRADGREYIQFLNQKVEKAQEVVNGAENKVLESDKTLNNELAAEIEKLKGRYEQLKSEAKNLIRLNATSAVTEISNFKNSIAAKEQEIINIDELEKQSLAAIDEKTEEQIKTVDAEAGNSKKILEATEKVEIEPLQTKANEVANMQSYLREFDRMEDIIKTKLSPKQELSQTLTSKIQKAREMPMELLKIAAVPIPGIAVDGEGKIRIGKTLIEGLSEGEQLELGFRVAKAQCGPLKVICLDGINKINDSDRIWIEREMESDEYQYFATNTEDGDLSVDIKKGA